jgi:hypothetical protein
MSPKVQQNLVGVQPRERHYQQQERQQDRPEARRCSFHTKYLGLSINRKVIYVPGLVNEPC